MISRSRSSSLVRSLVVFTCLALVASSSAAAPQGDASSLERDIDALLVPVFTADAPGAAAIVVKDGKVIYRKAFGLANLELRTPMRPDMVFEIGSVTKQFTSTAVLMLVDQGKVKLDEDIRTYVPTFPDKGVKITVENLLTHTSGIKSYTEDERWPSMWRKDLTPQEIIDITKDAPLEFPPGTKWNYSNTGYILLGAIVEKASGMSYADFVKKNIFEPLGMVHSTYGSASAVIPNRAYGYSRADANSWRNAEYLSMTQPYAAGSLMSSVDDLALWDAAVSAGKLLSKASWDRAFTSRVLTSGADTKYGFGWEIQSYDHHRVIRHNGGIFGYISEVLRLPDDHLYVALLTNSDRPPVNTGTIVTKMAALAIGDPVREPVAVALDPAKFDAYVGVYAVDDESVRTVTREGSRYFVQRTGRPKTEIFPLSDAEFFVKDSFQRFVFNRDASGKVTGMTSTFMAGTGPDETASRTDKPVPVAPKQVAVGADVLGRYVGRYALAPGFIVTVTLEDGHLMAQPTGQPKSELFPSSETEFFLTVVDAQVTFVLDAAGKVEKLVLHQGGRDVPGPKAP